jgi:hypothetical protein
MKKQGKELLNNSVMLSAIYVHGCIQCVPADLRVEAESQWKLSWV